MTPRTRLRLGFGLPAVLLAGLILYVIAPDLALGVETLGWKRTHGTTFEAYYHTQYVPSPHGGVDEGTDESWIGLKVAYDTKDTDYGVAEAFDAADLTPQPAYFPRPLSARVRHVLDQERPDVWYRGGGRGTSVLQAGIPFTAGVLLFPAVLLLAFGLATLRREPMPDGDQKAYTPLLGWMGCLVVIVFFLVFAVGISHLWAALFGCVPPWWLLPAFSALAILMAVAPRSASLPPLGSAIGCTIVLLPVIGLAGLIAMEGDSFGLEVDEDTYVAWLGEDHPAVQEYAAWHFARHPNPEPTLEPLRDLVLESDVTDTRQAALAAIRQMGPAALPALPHLVEALDDPRIEPLREELESLIRTLQSHRAAGR